MIELEIEEKERWKEFIIREAQYPLPDDCKGGICIDAGCNIGDFPINQRDRFDKYICFDVFDKNIEEAEINTKDLGLDIEIHKQAVWNVSNEWIDVMAYEPWDTKDLNHFGNSGNVGCVEFTGEQGERWSKDNSIGLVSTISIDTIVDKWGEIDLLKVDVEGSEYPFLMNKDLSKIKWISAELHGEIEKQTKLLDWISNTHEVVATAGSIKTWKRK
jgi:FkbM family methyltransferase